MTSFVGDFELAVFLSPLTLQAREAVLFSFKMGCSRVLKITELNYHPKKQNGLVRVPEPVKYD